MRIVYKSKEPNLLVNQKGFSTISMIIKNANKYRDGKIVFDMKKTSKMDGNLAGVYSALQINLLKRGNNLRILPRKACGVDVNLQKDMFGYFSSWEHEMEKTFQSGATKVFAFDPHDYESFNEYLLFEAFRKDWKGKIPYHYKLEVKSLLRELFRNASEHSNSNNPIIFCLAYDGEMLNATVVDCGEGFLKVFSKVDDEIINEGMAISRAMGGVSVKDRGAERSCSLLWVGEYCHENEGELFVISGSTTVRYDTRGFHQTSQMPAPFRGSIINFSLKITLPQFLAEAA